MAKFTEFNKFLLEVVGNIPLEIKILIIAYVVISIMVGINTIKKMKKHEEFVLSLPRGDKNIVGEYKHSFIECLFFPSFTVVGLYKDVVRYINKKAD